MTKVAAILRQVAVASFVAWVIALAIAPLLMWAQGQSFAGALSRSCFIVAVFVFGAGAAGVSGGVAPEPRFSWMQGRRIESRDKGPKTEGPLTLLGLALFIAPQLVAAGVALYS